MLVYMTLLFNLETNSPTLIWACMQWAPQPSYNLVFILASTKQTYVGYGHCFQYAYHFLWMDVCIFVWQSTNMVPTKYMFLNKQYFGNISLSFSKSIIVMFTLERFFSGPEIRVSTLSVIWHLVCQTVFLTHWKISRVYICMNILLLALFLWSTLKMYYFLIWLSSSMYTYVRPPQCTRMSTL